MLKVFTAQHQAEAHLVEDLLRSNGIEAHVMGDSLLNTAPGPLPFPGTAPEVWILNSDQAEPAFKLIRDFSSGQLLPEESGPSWQCPTCSEILESQFSECWKCGTPKPSGPSQA
jgi:Putative prokaryotic signal transducing protein